MNCSFLGDKWSSGPQWLFLHSKRLVIMYHSFFFMFFQLRFHFHHLHSLCLYCSMYATYFNLVAFQDSIHPHLCAPPALFTNSYNTQAILWSISLSVFLEPCYQATFHSSKDFYDPLLLTGGSPISSNYKGPPTNSNNSLEYKPPNSPDCFILSPKHMSYMFLHFVSSAVMLSSPLSVPTLCSLQGITGSNFFSKLSLFNNYMLLTL